MIKLKPIGKALLGALLRTTLLVVLAPSLSGCRETYTPKPRGYFRIDFPEKNYIVFEGNYPYSFEIPTYGKLLADNHPSAEPHWSNLVFEQFTAKLHLSYKRLEGAGHLARLAEDSRTFAFKHVAKATAIYDEIISHPQNKAFGLFYEIKGREAASPIQFFVTDSSRHFLRGALYFNVAPNNDSLAPVIQFLEEDIRHLISTLRW